RMQQRCRLKKQGQTIEVVMGIPSPRANDAIQFRLFFVDGEQLRWRSKYKLASPFCPEPNAIAVAKDFPFGDLKTVDEDPATLTAILYAKAAGHRGDHYAFARNARVIQCQMISALAAPSNEERQFVYGNHLTRPVIEHDLDVRMRRKS